MSAKNYVVMLAGGVGRRFHSDIPKQFCEARGKPVIVWSIENFQKNPNIDGILVVCIEEWIGRMREMVGEYSLTKVRWIIAGGDCSHDSIRNGIFFLNGKIDPRDYVIIHDAVRPILPQRAIDEVIRVARDKGNACSSTECHPPIVYTEDFESGTRDVDRSHVMLTASPQMFLYSLALRCYEQAERENRHDFTFTSSLLIHCGERVFFARGTSCNIKITTREDLALLDALLGMPEDSLYS